MDQFNKTTILFIGTLSCLLLSITAVPSTRVFELAPSQAPTVQPKASGIRLLANLVAKNAKQFSPEILKFCSGTEHAALCAETIAPYLAGEFDPLKALEMEINASMEKAKEIGGNIKKMLDNPATEKKAIDALGICQSQYDDMVDSMKEGVDLVRQQNVVDARYKLSSVLSYKSACDDAFTESPGVHIPFPEDITKLFQLTSNCLAVMDAIVHKHKM
ncbi:hypothetical protein AAZX31_10G012300 [Glycine max]|uniref:Pectinesterase inhibitor domain-containing protein n=3 Tax=Glycine subgen. Soja TaxID=1462606 RepID=I1L7N8_SOYBN|nr:uncharacterized protein LOC102667123 [Glycine max]XP_028183182.1 uncharacterized protein LOC114370098 [Glycine soja]KAG4981733.1 hypothetical protein JHK87_026482 [Glycine soja]KAH1136205.1 hypothetical protein GYH30_026615 [Glycine max]KAH1227160.1 hypothetical protein GmHk_10G027474 [Glycine max]KRH31784.1 hypothetical protein GLYMA_10G012100v4 [Glycine max]RZB85142.1 hypothetical protein D0Y65_025674 [Glycine soja]|eukprot:XP_006588562.1 uncharacterized protein LOC102667123 [Glycine max]